MNYVPYEPDPFIVALPWVGLALFILGMVALLIGLVNDAHGPFAGKARKPIFAIAALFAVAGLGIQVYCTVSGNYEGARQAEYLDEAAENLSDAYGVEVTRDDLGQLRYPLREPEGRVYRGTATIETGDGVEDFADVRLAYDDGRVYLLKQVGEEYEELSPAR